jgi:hypothetical protein
VFDHQSAAVPRAPRESSLWKPVPGDHGAHGPFEFRARNRDPLTRLATWLGAPAVQAISAVAAVATVVAATLAATTIFRRVRV